MAHREGTNHGRFYRSFEIMLRIFVFHLNLYHNFIFLLYFLNSSENIYSMTKLNCHHTMVGVILERKDNFKYLFDF